VLEQTGQPSQQLKFCYPFSIPTARKIQSAFDQEIRLKKIGKAKKRSESATTTVKKSKAITDRIVAIANKKCPDERFRSKFIELAQRLFKTGVCKQSLDWVG
jgi:hypothetical protein